MEYGLPVNIRIQRQEIRCTCLCRISKNVRFLPVRFSSGLGALIKILTTRPSSSSRVSDLVLLAEGTCLRVS